MKLILDFDDVLFKAKDLKAYMYRLLEEERVENVQGLYEKERAGGGVFSMKVFLRRVLDDGREGVEERVDALYGKILVKSKECINTEMLTLIEKVGKENCIIVTNGEEEWQTDKLQASGIGELVSLVYVVSGSKSECIEDLCARYSTQEIIFVDDKNDFFTDINMEKCKNLKTVIYNEHGLDNLASEIEESRGEEERKREGMEREVSLKNREEIGELEMV